MTTGLLFQPLRTADAAPPPRTPADYFQQQFGIGLGNVYWGDLHTHTMYSQDAALQAVVGTAVSTPATAYQVGVDRGMRFGAVTDHAEAPAPQSIPAGDPSTNVWASTAAMAAQADSGSFTPFLGYEYTNTFPCIDTTGAGDNVTECGSRAETTPIEDRACVSIGGVRSCVGYGHKNVVLRSLDAGRSPRISFLDPASWTAPASDCPDPRADAYCGFGSYTDFAFTNDDLWADLRKNGLGPDAAGKPQALTVIHSPGSIHRVDWDHIDHDFVRNVEIFSQWGNSEGPAPSTCRGGNDLDVSLPQNALNDETLLVRPQLQQHWLATGDERYALSFVGGSDDHAGQPGGDGTGNGGVTGVVTTTPGRAGYFDALADRHTLATTYYTETGPLPVLVGLETGSANYLGGDIGSAATGGATLQILADPRITQLEVVLDGCTVRTLDGSAQSVTLTPGELRPDQRHYIYVRARVAPTGDHHTDWIQTWSSPVYLRAQ